MNILLIEDRAEDKEVINSVLEKEFGVGVSVANTLQEGLELIEQREQIFDLIVCDYHGSGSALVKCLLGLVPEIPCMIMWSGKVKPNEFDEIPRKASTEFVDRSDPGGNLQKAVKALLAKGTFSRSKTPDADFVRVSIEGLAKSEPYEADIYIRLGINKFCMVFKKENGYKSADLERYLKRKGMAFFYLHKSQAVEALKKHDETLSKLAGLAEVKPEEARAAQETTLEIIKDVVDKLGFTPEAQGLAKKSVMLTLKVLGNAPKLSAIISRMRLDEGKYITSHSIMLGEIACAIAFRIGWSSAPTYLKLSLSAFLHDLSLKDNKLAQLRSLAEARKLSTADQQALKFHPINGADFARQFQEIPPDVDTIIVQHHERPDGSGFPRGLFHHQISPLACLFIIAHDLLDYHLGTKGEMNLEDFLTNAAQRYTSGTFRKIVKSLQTGTPLET